MQANHMSQHLKTFSIKLQVIVITLLFVCLISCASNTSPQSSASSNASTLPPIVAMVNDRPISTKLYEMYLRNGREALHDSLQLDESTDEGRRNLEKLREGIVSELIDRTLIEAEAERRGLTISPEKLKAAEERAIVEQGGDAPFVRRLVAHQRQQVAGDIEPARRGHRGAQDAREVRLAVHVERVPEGNRGQVLAGRRVQ